MIASFVSAILSVAVATMLLTRISMLPRTADVSWFIQKFYWLHTVPAKTFEVSIIFLLVGVVFVLFPMFNLVIAGLGLAMAVTAAAFFIPVLNEIRIATNTRLEHAVGNVPHLMSVFKSMDIDQDGVVNLDELRKFLLENSAAKELIDHDHGTIEETLTRMDVNGDHCITWPEFRLYFAKPDYQEKVVAQMKRSHDLQEHNEDIAADVTTAALTRTPSDLTGYKAILLARSGSPAR